MELRGSLKIIERGDPFTVREWRDMIESRAFKHFASRLDKLIEVERESIERAADAEAWRKAQGALKALRTVRSLPSIIDEELEGKTTRGNKQTLHS